MRILLLSLMLLALFGGFWIIWSLTGDAVSEEDSANLELREEAYRENNLGVALLEQFKHIEAAAAFKKALEIDPKLKIAQINLGIALYNSREIEDSLAETKKAAAIAPKYPHPYYMLGLIARLQNRSDDAIASFGRVLEFDPRDVGTNVNLGQIYMQQRKYAKAVDSLRKAVDAEPYNVTATYVLGTALLRSGSGEDGRKMLEVFQELRKSGASTSMGQNYLEQGRYAEAITSTGAEPELVDRKTPKVRFTEAKKALAAGPAEPAADEAILHALGVKDASVDLRDRLESIRSGSSVLFDLDGDGDLDVARVTAFGQRILRNDDDGFVDITDGSGQFAKPAKGVSTGVIAGDFDNDEKDDLFVLGYPKISLYKNLGDGRFEDATAKAGIGPLPFLSVSAAFVDYDHDGDLDIFIAGYGDLKKSATAGDSGSGAGNLLLRNNGDGTFRDVTATAKLGGSDSARAVAVVPFDYDNRRDVDLLVVNSNARPSLFRNLRDGTFRDVAEETGLGGASGSAGVAAGDVNKDGFTDLFFGDGTLAISDGKAGYALSKAPAGDADGVRGSQFLDYDNDGLLDLVTVGDKGVSIVRNLGSAWKNVTKQALAGDVAALGSMSSGDIDGDGDTDLLVSERSGELRLLKNNASKSARSVRVSLAGKVSNRSGIGAKVEIRAGSLIQKFEVYSATPAPAPADIVLGLGGRRSTDAVRVLWPAGIVQAEIESGRETVAKGRLNITELDRKPSSCPYLYTWNGREFEFITDFMGGGELGYWLAPGVRSRPDPDEYVRIRGDQLKERNGRYEIRVTNELEEALFVDHLKLLAVDHPEGTEVYPNEGLGNPTAGSFRLYATGDARPPVSARDEKGNDVLGAVTRMDRIYPDSFRKDRIRGYSERHSLILDLGKPRDGRTLLLMTGWTDYAFSSDNVAAAQRGMKLEPPTLEVRDGRGRWQKVIDNIGFPVGRPQTVTVDLEGKFLSESREVRITTNMRIYWDQILVAKPLAGKPYELKTAETLGANLRWRGFSRIETPDAREPYGFDYEQIDYTSPWKLMPGRYTRLGDVRTLLGTVDDMFVVSRPGDEISLSFDAKGQGPLGKGMSRTFLLYVDGFSKEMDINSGSPDRMLPLPFHGMSDYPYGESESYPQTPAHREYLERYNTRVVGTSVLPVEAILNRTRSQTERTP